MTKLAQHTFIHTPPPLNPLFLSSSYFSKAYIRIMMLRHVWHFKNPENKTLDIMTDWKLNLKYHITQIQLHITIAKIT